MQLWHVNVEQKFFKNFEVVASDETQAMEQVEWLLENQEDYKTDWSVADEDSDIFIE